MIGVGTRLQDFTTGSWALFKNERMRIVGLNTQLFDAHKHGAMPLVGDAQGRLEAARSGARRAGQRQRAWTERRKTAKAEWLKAADDVTRATNAACPPTRR